jgi:hypothetical protein
MLILALQIVAGSRRKTCSTARADFEFGMHLLLICVVALCAPAAARAEQPVVTFTDSGATAANITRGGEVIWLVASVEPFNGTVRLSRSVEVTKDDDRNGEVSIESAEKPDSLWIAVDFASGDYAFARRDGSAAPQFSDRAGSWMHGATDLDFLLSEAEVLMVRPHVGAWTVHASQGAYADADGRPDGNLRIHIEALDQLLGSAKAPRVANPNDLFVAVDTHALSLFVRRARDGR